MPALDVLAFGAALLAVLVLPRVLLARTRRQAGRTAPSAWGAPILRRRDPGEVARYHVLRAADHDDVLDDRVAADLDLDAVFAHLDRASGAPGQQMLMHWLRTPAQQPAPLRQRERVIAAVGDAERVRAAVHAACAPLTAHGAHALPDLLWAPLPDRPWWSTLLVLLPLGAAVAVLTVAIWPRALLVALTLGVVGVVVRAFVRPRVDRLVDAMRHMRALCAAGRTLSSALATAPTLAAEAAALARYAPALRRLEWTSRWVAMDTVDDTALSLAGFVDVLFSLDLATLYASLGMLHRERAALQAVFEVVGTLDAACAVASWRVGLPVWTRPVLAEPGLANAPLSMHDVRHPLVADAVPNDYLPVRPGLLVTGANMAGKSTYVRAVGLAAVLAQSVHTVPAAAYAAPFLTVRTSIGRADDVTTGTSYYRAEADTVLALLTAARAGGASRRVHLFLLDELFRGTNAVERVAAGAAVLDDLAALHAGLSHHVIAATHDGELVDRLAGRFTAAHFREQVGADGLTFDYRLHPGPTRTRNAIALLAQLGAPESVIAHAVATAAELDAVHAAARAAASAGLPA